jgi:hypothetical protein
MAHVVEHVSYMGSTKRHKIAGTGSRTNAYTDFHTTVFFAACPNTVTATSSNPVPSRIYSGFGNPSANQVGETEMFPLALDALVDVMEAQVTSERLEMEKNAVLSEASMINRIEYRSECTILSAIHKENRLPRRFPIGNESQIKGWTRDEVQFFHDLHYRPDNSVLYVVGDVARLPQADFQRHNHLTQILTLEKVEQTIKQKFGHLKPRIPNYKDIIGVQGNYPPKLYMKHSNDVSEKCADNSSCDEMSMQQLSKHFPPLVHKWSFPQKAREIVSKIVQEADNNRLSSPATATKATKTIAPDPPLSGSFDPFFGRNLTVPLIHQSPLLQSFTFHLSSKWPVMPTNTVARLARDITRKLIVSAMSLRLSLGHQQRSLYHAVDFTELNWPREGAP